MSKLFLSAAVLALSVSAARADFTLPTSSAGAGQYNVSINSVTSLTVPVSAAAAQICVDGGAAKYTDDGSTPNATTGMDAPIGCFPYGGPLRSFQIIGVASGATINVSYYK